MPSEGVSREKAVEILVALVKEKGLDNFETKMKQNHTWQRTCQHFIQGRDKGKAIEDAVAKLGIQEGKNPALKNTKHIWCQSMHVVNQKKESTKV